MWCRAVLLALFPAAAAAVQPPPGPLAVSEGSGADSVTLDRTEGTGAAPDVTLLVTTRSAAVPIATVGRSVDYLLARSEALRPLPPVFKVRLGAVRAALEAELQLRLRQPGANWNLATGRPNRGDYYAVVRAELAAILADSPLAAAFRRHGYRLSLDTIAEVRVESPHPARPAACRTMST